MTLVEFYDKTPIEGAASSLALLPEKVIFVGEKRGMQTFGRRLEALLASRGHTARMEYVTVSRTKVAEVISALEKIVEENAPCVFDLTGGEDLVLFAAGQVLERSRNKGIQCQWFNIRSGRVQDCDLDGQSFDVDTPRLTVEENMALHGGRVVYEEEKDDGTHRWPTDGDFASDIRAMWEVCAADCAKWNAQISLLSEIEHYRDRDADPLLSRVSMDVLWPVLTKRYGEPDLHSVFDALEQRGLFTEYTLTQERLVIRYKNESVRRALDKAGTALELMVWLLAREAEFKGERVYTDAMTGVYIDWDGVIHEKYAVETENEIDVLLMKGLVPYFISCKNGTIDTEELYKVQTVAEHFGGAYARKILICTTMGSLTPHKQASLRDRAKQMGILLLEGVHKLSEKEFSETLRKLDDMVLQL